MPVIPWSKTAMKTVGCVSSGPPPLLLKTVWGVIFSSLWAKLNEPTHAELVLLIVPRLIVEPIEVVDAVNFSTISFPSDPLRDETLGPRGAAGRSYSHWDEEEFLEWLSFARARNSMTLKSSVEGWPKVEINYSEMAKHKYKLIPVFLIVLVAMERFPKCFEFEDQSRHRRSWNLLSGRRTDIMMDNIRVNPYNVIIKITTTCCTLIWAIIWAYH